jgi:peroxiredoxin
MALTESNNFPLGSQAPVFELPDTVSGKMVTLSGLRSDKATVIMFICNHCPYVKHVNSRLVELAREYIQKGVAFIGISSNDVSRYPEDSPEKMRQAAIDNGYPFPYLYDESQDVAKAYDAACTPEFYVFNPALKLVYHGQMDDSRPNSGLPVTGADLARAIDLAISGESWEGRQKPGIGCGIKWK